MFCVKTECGNQDALSANITETWRLLIGASIFSIDVLADNSWQPYAVTPKKFDGWLLHILAAEPPTGDIEAAIRAWGRRRSSYGVKMILRRASVRGTQRFFGEISRKLPYA